MHRSYDWSGAVVVKDIDEAGIFLGVPARLRSKL